MKQTLTACIFVLVLFIPVAIIAQQPALSDKLPASIDVTTLRTAPRLLIVTTKALEKHTPLQRIFGGLFFYAAEPKKINIDSLLAMKQVLFIQPMATPKEEMVINGSDLSLNQVFFAQDKFPAITGKNVVVLLKEDRPDTADIDFRKRYFKTNLESSVLSSHATAMGTLIAGAGNTYYTGKGVAVRSSLGSVSYQVLLPEHDSIYKKYRSSVENHSYGTGIENFYGADSWAYDLSVKNNDSLLHVFSAGNSGTLTSTAGKYAGIAGFANITGSFKQTKNSLSVAATDSFYHVEVLSSKGPAYDGRIKPELTAFGQDGSSGAAALVSGTSLLIQDAYRQQQNKLPSSSLVRAALVNAADDIAQAGPDFKSGFGSLNTERSIRQIVNNQYFTASVASNTQQEFSITVPVNSQQLKVSLAWNDAAAAINATKALVNDLDLEVVEISTGNIYLPFVLNHYPHIDSLNAIAVRKKDTLNNIEQVVITLPAAGNYLVRVKGSAVQGTQSFDVVYNIEKNDVFEFTYPSKNSNLYPGISNTIRWNNTVAAATGNLQISYNGTDWFTIAANTSLDTRYVKTVIKDTVTMARLRMVVGSNTYFSDSFTISPRLQVNVAYNCPDSFQLYWNKMRSVNAYDVFALTDTMLQKIRQTTDTSVTLPASNNGYYAIAPVVGNRNGLRSYAFNPATQGVGCYINSFLADVFDDTTVQLKVVLGTRYGLKDLSFQRLYPLTTIATLPVNKDTFSITDVLLKPGIYYYRVKLLSQNGQEVISDTMQVRIFQTQRFFVYPNPYRNNGRLVIQSKDYNDAWFELFNLNGQKCFSQKLNSPDDALQLPPLNRGMYFYRIVQQNKRVDSGKLIVQ